MKKGLKIIAVVIGCLLIGGVISVSYFIGRAVFNGSMQMTDNESTSKASTEGYFQQLDFDLEKLEAKYNIRSLQIQSTLDGHTIPIDHITIKEDKPQGTIVMVHGLGGNRWTNYPVAAMFLENGYNILTYDQRSSGENTAQYTTYGYWESHDLKDCITYLENIIGEAETVGIWGASFGGATAGIYLGSSQANRVVSFAVLDCPISNMSQMLSTEMERMDVGIPVSYMLSLGNIITKMKLGFSYQDADVCKHINTTTVPVLIINSRADEVTPFFMGEDIYNAIAHSDKELVTVEGSGHCGLFFDYPHEYQSIVLQFINTFNRYENPLL